MMRLALQAGEMTRNVVGTTAIPTVAQTVFPVTDGFVRGLANGADGNVWYSATGGASGIGPTTPNGFGRITPEGVNSSPEGSFPVLREISSPSRWLLPDSPRASRVSNRVSRSSTSRPTT